MSTTTAIQVSHCFCCHQRIELLGGSWTDPAGCIACCLGDPSVAYAPHQPIPGCTVADQIMQWSEVREGDLVLLAGDLHLVERILPTGWGDFIICMDGHPGTEVAAKAYAAVRRYVIEEG